MTTLIAGILRDLAMPDLRGSVRLSVSGKFELDEVLAAAREGKVLEPLRFTATTYIQRDEPNRNFVRFKRGALARIAKSGKGSPFLANHDQGDVRSRGGTVLSSKLERHEDGSASFVQEIEAVKPWAIEGVLDGTIDRFSIGWAGVGEVRYSHNGESVDEDVERNGWPSYWPGDKLEDGTIVEWVFDDAELIEVSAVNVPAVTGTGIRATHTILREAMSLALNNRAAARTGDHMIDKVKAQLGLSASATEAEVLEALAARDRERNRLQAEHDTLAARNQQSEARLAELAAEQEAEARKLKAQRIDQRIAQLYTEGRLLRVEGKASPFEEHLRRLGAEQSIEAFEAYCDGMPKLAPVGGKLQKDEQPVVDDEGVTPEVKRALQQCGLTVERARQLGTLPPLNRA